MLTFKSEKLIIRIKIWFISNTHISLILTHVSMRNISLISILSFHIILMNEISQNRNSLKLQRGNYNSANKNISKWHTVL